MRNQPKYDAFRKVYSEFVYESYQYDVQPDGLHIVFGFRVNTVQGKEGSIVFRPTAFIPRRSFLRMEGLDSGLDRLVFNIGMIELISYWKCYCPPRIVVRCGSLSDEQVAFWRKLYYNGLGEFFYTNGIHATQEGFASFEVVSLNREAQESTGADWVPNGQAEAQPSNYLVPIGGGKDSVVTLELLKEHLTLDSRPVPLIMNPRGATIGCIQAAGYSMDEVLVIQRNLDPRMLELNQQGCLNGHTPFSALLAFYCLLAARLSGIPNIALSNESSANEATVIGTMVNHQYSKSLEFENDFRQYCMGDPRTRTFRYFSFLRPLSELQIAMLFSHYGQYYDVFRSCNAGSKTDVWCGQCAKCLFAYLILSPFIDPDRLNAIFGKNMLDDISLRPLLDQLTGLAETKPFECVGTINEVHTAIGMTLRRWYAAHRPALLEDYVPRNSSVALDELSLEHNLTDDELSLLRKHVQAATV